jgi:hypothetical protein
MSRAEQKERNRRRRAILDALDEQLSSPESPEVKREYERLLSLGITDFKVRLLMARVFASYVWHTLRKDNYTYADYVLQLSKLPEIDWGEYDDDDTSGAPMSQQPEAPQ